MKKFVELSAWVFQMTNKKRGQASKYNIVAASRYGHYIFQSQPQNFPAYLIIYILKEAIWVGGKDNWNPAGTGTGTQKKRFKPIIDNHVDE